MRAYQDYSLSKLAAQTDFLNKSDVLFAVFFSDVLEVALSLTNCLEQSTTSHEVVLVQFHVLG